MVRWLWRKLFPPKEVLNVYSPRERMIFSYFDGGGMRKADPLELSRGLMNHYTEIMADLRSQDTATLIVASGKPWTLGEFPGQTAVRLLRKVFDVKPAAEGGLTESEVVALLDHFLAYCEDVKKKFNPSPTPSPTSAWPGPSSAGDPTTRPSSACTSAGPQSITAGPGPSS